VLHADRARAEAFGDDAERYERTRPSYPPELVDDLVAGGTPRVLDVGCGTGKAARLFAGRGCAVLGVEVDGRMAEIARSHGIEVEVAGFEAWEDRGRRFDLVVAGQAWHWVDPARGPAKAASVLDAAGRLAPFWNFRRQPAEQVRRAFDELYRRVAPEIADGAMALGAVPSSNQSAGPLRSIEESGLFGSCDIRRYRWQQRYTTRAWCDLIPTHSDHHLLAPDRLDALLEGVATLIDGLGGVLVVDYETTAVIAAKKGA